MKFKIESIYAHIPSGTIHKYRLTFTNFQTNVPLEMNGSNLYLNVIHGNI